MSLPIKFPVTARPTITQNIFAATWNAPTVGKYDFSNAVANQDQVVLTMTGSSVYIIERVSFSMSVPEGVFQSSIDSAVFVPQLVFKTAKTDVPFFDRPLPFVNYVDNLELLMFIPSDQSGDEIRVTFQGVLDQVPATVGIVTIRAFLQLNIYEVQNSAWTSRFYHSRNESMGDLALRGVNQGTFC